MTLLTLIRLRSSIQASKQTIAVDFDGVIHQYRGGKGLGVPIPGSKGGIQALQSAGIQVVVFTVRQPSIVSSWLKSNGFPPLQVTNTKMPATVYLDDRGFRFTGKWSPQLVKQLLSFKTYWETDVKATMEVGPNWTELHPGIQPVPTFHPPSLKNPIPVKQSSALDGFRKGDSAQSRIQAQKDLLLILSWCRRQFGKPEIYQTAQIPLFPDLLNRNL